MTAGQIHDIGYQRYAGGRRALETRWAVIMRHQVAIAWKTWWRFKLWLIVGALATAVSGGVLYFVSNKTFRMIGGLAGQLVRFADGILPSSTLWYCKIGLVASLTLTVGVIASDAQSGAFTFYFARSVRPRDYVLGKLAGLGGLMALIMLGGPLVLALLRIGLSETTAEALAQLPGVAKALAIGALGTLIYTAVPLGFSALIANRWYAMASWAAYYLAIGEMAQGLARVSHPAVGALDLPRSLHTISLALFDLQRVGFGQYQVPTTAAVGSILGHAAVAIAVVGWRVRRAQRTGLGGSA